MTPIPANYEGFKEKLFWVIIATIASGTLGLIGLIWGLSVDVKVIKTKDEQAAINDLKRTELVEQALEMSRRNNVILNTKADESTNEMAHKQIIVQLDDVSDQLHRVIMRIYGVVNKPNTTYLLPILDSIIYTDKLPIILKPKIKHGNI